MKQLHRYNFSLIVFYIGYLVCLFLEFYRLTDFIKPLLIPALIPIVWTIENDQVKRLLIVSLFFSFLGDVFLIFEGQLFFILGLVSFLLAHVFYITLSIRFVSISNYFVHSLIIGLLFLAYLVLFLRYLSPYLGELLIPVIAYATLLAFFGMLGGLLFIKYKSAPSLSLMLGSLFFIASDSLLAISTFRGSFNHDRLMIMFTYLSAQFFIVQGIRKLARN